MSNDRRRTGALGTWVPLVVTAAVATVSVAAWIWSQRKDRTEEFETNSALQDLDYENADYGDNPPYGASSEGRLKPPTHSPNAQAQQQAEGGGWGLQRTPSPADFFNSAKRQVAAGVTAAGAAVGTALSAIREEDSLRSEFADDETWSDPGTQKQVENVATSSSRNDAPPVVQPTTVTAPVTAPATASIAASSNKNQRRKKVAIIVSADSHVEAGDEEVEHAVSVCLKRSYGLVTNNRPTSVYPLSHPSQRRSLSYQALRFDLCSPTQGQVRRLVQDAIA